MGGKRINIKEDIKSRVFSKERILVNWIVISLIATSMVGIISRPASASPVVQNPGFEIPGPAYWNFTATESWIIGVYPTGHPHSDSESVGIQIVAPEPPPGEGYWNQIQITPVEGGMEYRISAWVDTSSADPATISQVGVLWYQGTSYLSEAWSPGVPGGISWVEEGVISTAPSNADNTEIRLKLSKPDGPFLDTIVYFDDVSMVETTGSLSVARGPYSPEDHDWFYDPDGDPYNEMLQFNLTIGSVENVRVDTITIQANGTGNDAEDIGVVDLVVDVNNNGSYDDDDIFLTSGSYPADNASLTLTIPGGRIIPADGNEYWLIAYEMTNTSLPGDTFTFDLIDIDAVGMNSGNPIPPEGLPISACNKTTVEHEFIPPITTLVLGDPHDIDEFNRYWVNWETPFRLLATDNQSYPLYGDEKGFGIESTWYKIDADPWNEYSKPFNLSGRAPGAHTVAYYSIDTSGNKEVEHYITDIIVDDTPPELMSGYAEPSSGEEGQVFGYNVTYVDDSGRHIPPFKPSKSAVFGGLDDQHVRKTTGYDNNTHFVWMSDRTGKWEVYYKEIDPNGIAIRFNKTDIVQNQTIINDTMISDSNNTDSLYPSLVLEPHEEVYLNDTIYDNKYAILAAPVRYYYDQKQLLENNSVLVNVTPNHWQEFVAGGRWADEGRELWVDIMIYKDPTFNYTNPLNITVTNIPNNKQVFSQSMPADQIVDGDQWLAFFNKSCKLIQGIKYRIDVTSKDPYKWYYCHDTDNNPYPQSATFKAGSSLDPNDNIWKDFTFIIRVQHPEIRFKYEVSKMRDTLIAMGYTDDKIHMLTIPYWVTDSLNNSVCWRIPWSDLYPTIIWQPLPFNFTEPWIDGLATHNNLWNALNSTRENSTGNDIIFIELRDHGGGRKVDGQDDGGRQNGYAAGGNLPNDPRVANDEPQDHWDESFQTYADPNDRNRASTNSWFDDELDIELDKMTYKNMVIEIDTCHAGGFIPDLSGPGRTVLACGREDEVTYSYVYRFFERLLDSNADVDNNSKISVEEAHNYAVKCIPIEKVWGAAMQHPQMNVFDYVHVVWADKRDDPNPNDSDDIWEIYYSKLDGVVNYSAANNGVDLTSPDWRVSLNDGKSSGRVVKPTVDGAHATYIEHPDIDIDSKLNISIVWSDYRNGTYYDNWEIYYQFQDNDPDNDGIPITFIDDTRISDKTTPESSSIHPVVSVGPNDKVHIAWQDNIDGPWEIYYEQTDPYMDDLDGDAAIDPSSVFVVVNDKRATTNDGAHSATPDIAVDSSGYSHIAFMDMRSKDPGHEKDSPNPHKPGYWEIYTLALDSNGNRRYEKRQSDMKNPHTSHGRYTGPPDGYSMYPRIAVSRGWDSGDTFVTWHDNRTGNWEIFYSEVHNWCNNPNSDIQVTNNVSSDMYPDIAINIINDPNIKWQTDRNATTSWDIWNADWNDLHKLNIEVDGNPHHGFQDFTSDTNSADGIFYVYGCQLQAGNHTYRFSANNGLRNAIGDIYEHIGPDVSNATIPGAPTNIIAKLEGSIFQHVNITWTLSEDDGAGENDVAGYDIYYNRTYSRDRTGYTLLDSVGAGVSYYVHENAGDGDPNNYFYYVAAKDDAGHENESIDQVGKFVRELPSGRQLISIPLVQSDTNIVTVLQTVEWDITRWYDSTDTIDHWKCYFESKPSDYNDLLYINHKMALWINVTIESNLTVVGVVPESTTIQLYKGWNFVGYPSLTNKTVGDALSDIWENVTQVEGFNDTNMPYYLEILSGDDMMVTGHGYWIYVTKNCEWTVKN